MKRLQRTLSMLLVCCMLVYMLPVTVLAANYLLNNFDAIYIYNTDAQARNDGATEPHVSHVLSSRLSSRPMGWSAKTLKIFDQSWQPGGVPSERLNRKILREKIRLTLMLPGNL